MVSERDRETNTANRFELTARSESREQPLYELPLRFTGALIKSKLIGPSDRAQPHAMFEIRARVVDSLVGAR